jgi:hypothetical protein
MLENHVSQLQRAMTVSAMENMALRQELVRAKKLKDSGSKSGVAEPAVLESSKSTLSCVPCILVFMCVICSKLGDLSGPCLVLEKCWWHIILGLKC